MQNSEANRQNYNHIKKGCENFSKTRTISSNTCVNGESGNWRSDYHKFKGHTFAHVLKSAVTSTSLASKKSRPICSKAHSLTKFTNSKVVKVVNIGKNNCQTKKPCNPKPGDKVSASIEAGKAVNVSNVANQKMQKMSVPGKVTSSRHTDVGSSGIPTYNRYEVLNLDDGVVLHHSDIALPSPQSDYESSESGERDDSTITSNDLKNHTVSYCDTMTKARPTVFP